MDQMSQIKGKKKDRQLVFHFWRGGSNIASTPHNRKVNRERLIVVLFSYFASEPKDKINKFLSWFTEK